MAGKAPLHKRVHWRTIRTIIRKLSKHEKINYNDYDLENINCRETLGTVLHGKNVKYDISECDRSYFVTNNTYNVFEIPSLKNKKGSPYGKFLILCENVNFGYWMFGTMTCELDVKESIRTRIVRDSYSYDILGHYSIVDSDRSIHFSKYATGDNISIGSAENNKYYNGFDRKKAYKTNDSKILMSIGVNSSTKRLSDTDSVKIYKKKRQYKYRKGGRA